MIVIDNSLCNIDISENATEQNIHEYIVSLFESGIDAAEIDSKTYKYLEDINTSNRFIMRVDSPEDLLYVRLKEFFYVVVPYDLIYIVEKSQKTRYLAEINGDGCNTDELLKKCRSISDRNIKCAVRIVKNFDTETEELSEFIDRYYDEFTMPLDICPLNSYLTGLDSAYKAFSKGVNMLTLGFASSCLYTPYELFVMYFPEDFKLHPQLALITYLLVCAARYNLVTDEFNKGLYNIVNLLDNFKQPVIKADSQFNDSRLLKRFAGKSNDPFEVFSEAQMSFFRENSLDLGYAECKKLAEVLDSSDLILYNRFFSKDDFKN